MPTTLRPKAPGIHERILLVGPGGSGKSNAVITMMRRITDAHFYIIDNDDSYNFLIYEDEEQNAGIIERQNFTILSVDATDWDEQKAAIQEVQGMAQEGDWCVFDMASETWSAVADWYTHTIFEQGYVDYAIEMRRKLEEERQEAAKKQEKEKRTQPLFDQFRDYGVINPEYKKGFYSALTRVNSKAHVLITAEVAELNDNDPLPLRKLWGPAKCKPRGQNRLGHFPHTAIVMSCDLKTDIFSMTVVKDRGSRGARKLKDEPWEDFTRTYLQEVAGWKKGVVR